MNKKKFILLLLVNVIFIIKKNNIYNSKKWSTRLKIVVDKAQTRERGENNPE